MAQDYQETLLPCGEPFGPPNGSPKWQEAPVKSTRLPEENENIGGKNRGKQKRQVVNQTHMATCTTRTIRNQQGLSNQELQQANPKLKRANRARS